MRVEALRRSAARGARRGVCAVGNGRRVARWVECGAGPPVATLHFLASAVAGQAHFLFFSQNFACVLLNARTS